MKFSAVFGLITLAFGVSLSQLTFDGECPKCISEVKNFTFDQVRSKIKSIIYSSKVDSKKNCFRLVAFGSSRPDFSLAFKTPFFCTFVNYSRVAENKLLLEVFEISRE
jgi:hypothetical protein